MSEVVRVGVIGTRAHGRAARLDVLSAWTASTWSPSQIPRRRRASARCAARPACASTTTGARCSTAEASSLDAVSVACPSSLHCEIALAALEHGLHVLVEKPIATTLPDALRMRAAARDAGRKLMVGHVERFNPAVAKLRDLVRAGRLGDIYRIQATRVGPSPLGAPDTGVSLDLASHDLDVMQFVLGQDISR